MKTNVRKKTYEEVLQLPQPEHQKPLRQTAFWRKLLKLLSDKEIKDTHFRFTTEGMEKLGKDEPCMFLMNHSSFTDLQILSAMLADREYHIVCTRDGFVGKDWLLRRLGCIPTNKFVSDTDLIRDMKYCLNDLKSSVVLYPEASYSFDGTETPLPKSLGKCLKFLRVPVVMIKTEGAYLRDPLYNNLQKRKVNVSAVMTYLLSPQELAALSPDEINGRLQEAFRYDHFKTQVEKGIRINEPFRADGLHRALYKCPKCGHEGCMTGKGTGIDCSDCGAHYELDEFGKLHASEGETEFEFVSDWYAWERACVREELEAGTYRMDEDVEILILKDLSSLYDIGEGHLSHTREGFRLTGADGKLDYTRESGASYSLYSDYYWYEIGDMIAIGDDRLQYYCFPKNQAGAIVAKARLAAEEAFKLLTI